MPKRRAGSPAIDLEDMNTSNRPVSSTSTSVSDSQHERQSKRRRVGEASQSESTSQAKGSKKVKKLKRLRAACLAAERKRNTQIVEQSKPDDEAEEPSAPPTPHSLPRHISPPPQKDSEEVLTLRMLLKEKEKQIEEQNKALNSMHQQVQCQICLETLSRPFALVPCGHVCCLGCLQQWFKAPPMDDAGRPRVPLIRRKKTCPHCRSTVTQRPVEVYVLKEIISYLEPAIRATPGPDRQVANPEDPWKDIFPNIFHGANHTADGALIDHQDGGGYCGWCGEYYGSDLSDEDDADDLMPPIPGAYAGHYEWDGFMEDDEEDDQDVYEADFIDDRGEMGTVYEEDDEDDLRSREDEFVQRQVAGDEGDHTDEEDEDEEDDEENEEITSDGAQYDEDDDVGSERGPGHQYWRESDHDADDAINSNIDDNHEEEPPYVPRYNFRGPGDRLLVQPIGESRGFYVSSDSEDDGDDSAESVVAPRLLSHYEVPRYVFAHAVNYARGRSVYNDIEDWEDEEGEFRRVH
ncbi:hypothetical protein FRC17_004346 [Serendipita sp. 399]|nr:hypothetical protein FRC17_004346 [Serendipita sp. 399]